MEFNLKWQRGKHCNFACSSNKRSIETWNLVKNHVGPSASCRRCMNYIVFHTYQRIQWLRYHRFNSQWQISMCKRAPKASAAIPIPAGKQKPALLIEHSLHVFLNNFIADKIDQDNQHSLLCGHYATTWKTAKLNLFLYIVCWIMLGCRHSQIYHEYASVRVYSHFTSKCK